MSRTRRQRCNIFAMAAGIAVGSLVGSSCSNSAPRVVTLEDALKRQPAELVKIKDSFRIGRPLGCDGVTELTSELAMRDETNGKLIWRRPVPWSDSAVVVGNDEIVVTVAYGIDDFPPSVAATDASTGAPLWQRFISSESLHTIRSDDKGIEIATDDDRVQAIDAEGNSHTIVSPEGNPGSITTTTVADRNFELLADGHTIRSNDSTGRQRWRVTSSKTVRSIIRTSTGVLTLVGDPYRGCE